MLPLEGGVVVGVLQCIDLGSYGALSLLLLAAFFTLRQIDRCVDGIHKHERQQSESMKGIPRH